jgi:DNA-binding NarL/FixJ family response regulator
MTRVATVDDHGLFRAGVRAELEDHVELVGEAASVEEAVALVVAQHPDVVLLDVHMPGGGGVAVIRGSADEAPDTLFLARSASSAAEDVIATIRAARAAT